MAALVVVLILCVSGLTAVSMQVRCIDAAREAARLAARGDGGSASSAAQRTAPDGAAVQLRREGELRRRQCHREIPVVAGHHHRGGGGRRGRTWSALSVARPAWWPSR